MINYSDDPFLKLKEISPFYCKLYNFSVFMTYIGFIIISWYFINLAYTINTPSYDILCFGCNLFSHLTNVCLLLIWLFFLYFYILNEIRFRFAHYSGRKNEKSVKVNNSFFILGSVFLTVITLFIIL
ncbi:MAG: hypothetical protein PHY80_04220 [Rickettsiales bacterium]|nr:hypothetical protein [Rickettsiales bacterium]